MSRSHTPEPQYALDTRLDREPPLSRGALLGFTVLLALALFAVLFPWFPGMRNLVVGRTVDRAIIAPKDVAFESPVRTVVAREQAAAAIENIYMLDPAVRDRQLASLTRIVNAIDQQRRNTTLSDSARETSIRGVTGVNLSQPAAALLSSASALRFQIMSEQATNALGRTLTGAVGAADVEVARERASSFVSQVTPAESAAVSELIAPLVVPTLAVAVQRTEALRREAMANTPPVQVTLAKGDVVVEAGAALSEQHLEALMQLGIRDGVLRPPAIGSSALFSVVVAAAMSAYLAVARPRSLRGPRRLLLYALLLLTPAMVLKFALPLLLPDLDRQFLAYAIPVAAAPMIAAVLLEVPAGVLLATLLAAIAGYISVYLPLYGVPGDLAQIETARLVFATGASSLAGLFVAARAQWVQRYLLAGIVGGVAAGAMVCAMLLLDADRQRGDLSWIALTVMGGGVLSGLLTTAAFVLLSRPFGIVTRVSLMERAQLDQPLLRRLQDEAPGTFQHSILVGNLAERAADRIGADALLTRVGAYYHDIGKLVAPPFFVENLVGDESPHEQLDPLQSTRVILQHVTAGMELARRERVPEAIAQFIREHHGTRIVAFFYRRAAALDPNVSPELFRYPGPRPQSRETALVMLADASEATVRASAARTPEAIRAVVEEIVRERIEEGQFDDCNISLRDLRVTVDSYVTALSAVYHPRVEYPKPTRRERAARGALLPPQPRLPAPSRPVLAENFDEDAAPTFATDLDVDAAPTPRAVRAPDLDRPALSEDTT